MLRTSLACTSPLRQLGHELFRIVAAATLVCAASAPAAATTQGAARVRSTDAAILELLKEGAERSATLRSLIGAIDQSNGIVYVEFGYCAFGRLNGCLLPFIGASQGDRYLRIVITRDKNRQSHDQLIALIGHELRHALEAIEHPDVVDAQTLEAMYRRIGTSVAGQHSGYETSAARAAGDAVLAELSATRTAR